MAVYVQLPTLTLEGRERAFRNLEDVIRVKDVVQPLGIQVLGQFGVLGEYDFVIIVEAPANAAIARFSLQFWVRMGAHITTLPTIAVRHFELPNSGEFPWLETGVAQKTPVG